MIKAGIIGSTGYAGQELVRLLYGHKEAEIKWYGSRSYVDQKYASVYQNMFQIVDAKCMDDNMDALADAADVIFTATPQGLCASLVNEDVLNKVKIIDLSADFRIKDVEVYEKWYGIKHKSPSYIKEAVYGLCEINREDIKGARLIANPGCYTTCSILTCYPLVKEGLIDPNTIIVDAKSGTSGAGRGAKTANLFCEVNENMKAYGVATHRHTPEIEEQLGYAAGYPITINFTPHLVPMNRGILITAYASLKKEVSYEEDYEEPVQYVDNDSWYTTKEVVTQEASTGHRKVTALVTYKNGNETGREIIAQTIVTEAKPKIIERGTQAPPTYIKPISGGRYSSGFGKRWGRMHKGVDWACSVGTAVKASCGGTVVSAGWSNGYGYCITIRHPDGKQTRYAHLSKILVSSGKSVKQGDKIALSGNTGRSTGPHIHFEILVNGSQVNPLKYLN